MDDLASVQKAVWDGRVKWYNIGLLLGLNAGDLDAIRDSERGDPDRCLTSTLKKWLFTSDLQPSWSSLADVLRAPTVGLGQLADEIDSCWNTERIRAMRLKTLSDPSTFDF